MASRLARHNSATMATNGTKQQADLNLATEPTSGLLDDWLRKFGRRSFRDFKKDHPTNKLSYDDWCQTEQVYGGFLYYVASLIWDEDEDEDDISVCVRFQSTITTIFLMETG